MSKEPGRVSKALPIILASLSVLYLGLYTYEVLADPVSEQKNVIELASNGIWLIFASDYLIRFIQAPSKFIFIKGNFLELMSLVLPAVRALRMFRVITSVSQFSIIIKNAQQRINFFMATSLPLIYLMCALGVLDAERHAIGAKILTFDDSLWWSLTTIATVGYGDLYPVTTSGRLIGAVLILTGLGFMSLITANIASWFMKSFQTAKD